MMDDPAAPGQAFGWRGLCPACAHVRLVPGRAAVFYLCKRSLTDPRFPRYPPIPVVDCSGYAPRDDEPGRSAP